MNNSRRKTDGKAQTVDLSRRRFLQQLGWVGMGLAASGGLGSLLASCAPTAAPQEAVPLTLQLNWIRNVEFAGNWYAMENGYYEEEGIKLAVEDWAPTVEPIQSVVSGTADIGFVSNGLTIASARDNGLPVKAFGAGFQKSPGGLVVLEESGITSPSDLVGKTVGIQQTGRLTWEAFAKATGLDGQVETMVVSFDPTPLVAGQVDAYMGYINNQPIALAEQGVDTNFIFYADHGFPRYDLVAFATDEALENNPELIQGWLRATIRGWHYAFENPEEVTRLVVEEYGEDLDIDQQIAEINTQIPLMQSDLTEERMLFAMAPSIWSSGLSALKELGEAAPSLEVEDFVTWEVLEAVEGTIA